jgi:hypothetical protein
MDTSGHTFNDEHDGHAMASMASSVEFQLSCREILSKAGKRLGRRAGWP